MASVDIWVDVQAQNDRPCGQDDDYVAAIGEPIDIGLYGSDLETDYAELTFNVPSTTVAGGILYPADHGQYSYQPKSGHVGEDSFTYTITDTGLPGDAGSEILTSPEYTISLVNGYQVDLDGNGTWEGYDADGDWVTISLRGEGAGTLLFPKQGNSDPLRLTLRGTTDRSSLTISTKGRGSDARIGDIVLDNGLLGSLTAKTTDIVGDGISTSGDGYIGSICVRDCRNGADILLSGTGATKGVAITAGVLYPDTAIVLGSYLKNLTVTEWVGSSLTAPWASSMSIKGDRRNGITGDFGANLTFTGAEPRKDMALSKLSVAGTITDSIITANFGSVGTITAAQWDDGLLNTMWVKSLITKGNRRDPSITGDFQADLDVGVLGKGKIDGGVLADRWVIPDGIGKLQVNGDFQADLDVGVLGKGKIDGGVLADRWVIPDGIGKLQVNGDFQVANLQTRYADKFDVGGSVVDTEMQIGQMDGQSAKKMSVDGWLRNSRILGEGEFGKVEFGGMDSGVFGAGLFDTLDGFTPGAAGYVKKFDVGGVADPFGFSMIDSLAAAHTFNKVSLESVQGDNSNNAGYPDLLGPGDFGIAADVEIGKLQVERISGEKLKFGSDEMPDGQIFEDFWFRVV